MCKTMLDDQLVSLASPFLHFRIISLCSNPAGGSFVCSASVHRSRSASGSSELQGYTGKVGKLSYWDLRTMKMIVRPQHYLND